MSKQEKGITIRQYGGGWKATVPVLRDEFTTLDGVMGKQSDSGPWIGGEGDTPDEALRDLHRAIGLLLLPALLSSRKAGEP